ARPDDQQVRTVRGRGRGAPRRYLAASGERKGCVRRYPGVVFGRMAESVRRLLGKPGAVDLRPYTKLLSAIEAEEEGLRELSDTGLTEKAIDLGNAELPYERDDLVLLCAVGREAARRTLEERPFDVHLLGVMALLDSHVADIATGPVKALDGDID